MPITPEQFGLVAQSMGTFVLISALLTGIAFSRKWGWRFRMVGITSFAVVLTAGLFALSLTPLTRQTISGSTPYTVVYDRFGSQAVIAVSPEVTPEQLEATLKQAAANLFSSGRSAGSAAKLTIRARTLIHPSPDVSQPIYIGKVERSLHLREDPEMVVQVFADKLAMLK